MRISGQSANPLAAAPASGGNLLRICGKCYPALLWSMIGLGADQCHEAGCERQCMDCMVYGYDFK